MMLNEVDDGVDSYPSFPGIKHAAIRKLKHELGIEKSEVPHSDFRFLTRFHYWAADTVTYGKEAPWGEHEIDYVLFIKCDGDGPPLDLNTDEVDDYKYVTSSELQAMMKNSAYLWSPWFCGIMERGGFEWWENMDESLKMDGSKYCNRDITYFDPPEEHMGSYNLNSHKKDMGVLISGIE
uniref:Nudix hydrolase domain-containing protein n=1 Tax=Trieres chinensis TaxID=1514140 RepID=A0A7S1ZYJ9_TRICV|mmetsp:Transcript_35766/g.73142  ORF Transcript_35766/g.73142 Transcript_35766/m.73142 type:complete len:180 (+) Transcript_35766:1-540(+)